MKVAIRVDASARIGRGHFSRCAAVAQALAARGADVTIVRAIQPRSAVVEPHSTMPWETIGITPPDFDLDATEPETTWPGDDQREDARRTRIALKTHPPDVVIVDHYGLDATWESEVAEAGHRIVVIDDLANRPHVGDLLVDTGIRSSPNADYASLVPKDCRLLAGPRYAPLAVDYAERHDRAGVQRGPVRRILVSFGTTQSGTPLVQALRVMSRPEFVDLALDVVVPHDPTIRAAVEQAASKRAHTTVHVQPPGLGDLLERCDLAIGAGGVSSLERMCLGIPSIVTAVAPNQQRSGETLERLGLAVFLGPIDACSDERLRDALSDLVANTRRRSRMARRTMAEVDGQGAGRIATATLPGKPTKLVLRPATPSDAYRVLSLANNPAVRENSLSREPIDVDDHLRWFEEQLVDPATLFLLFETAGTHVGQIRFAPADDHDVVSYSLDAAVRGRGLGQEIVRMGCRELRARRRRDIRAVVRSDNTASRRVFSGLGFDERSGPEPGATVFTLSADRAI